jgi:hypothetical protein
MLQGQREKVHNVHRSSGHGSPDRHVELAAKMNRLLSLGRGVVPVVRVPSKVRQLVQKRCFGGHGGHGGPHIPEFHDNLGKFCLVSAFLWIFFRAKENKGQIFGWYLPWLHEHEHLHLHYMEGGDVGDSMPTLNDDDEEEEEHEEEE